MFLIIILLMIVIGCIVYGGWKIYTYSCRRVLEYREKYNRFFWMYKMLYQWMENTYKQKSIEKYLINNNWKTIAIYGCGDIGKLIYEELKDSTIDIKCGIDKNSNINFPLRVVDPQQFNECVDVILVASIVYYYEIEKELKRITDIPIVSIEDMVYEIGY